MNKMWYFVDRVKERWLSYYRKNVFLGRIKSSNNCLNVLGEIYVNATNIKIGKNVTIYPGVYFWGDGKIVIGNNVDIGVGTIIFSKNKVTIGNNVSIAGQCYIIDSNHSTARGKLIQQQEMEISKEGLYIGNDVWIGAGTKILKGANIKNGAVIGAMSLVNKLINENAIAYGVPAKVIKYRNI